MSKEPYIYVKRPTKETNEYMSKETQTYEKRLEHMNRISNRPTLS